MDLMNICAPSLGFVEGLGLSAHNLRSPPYSLCGRTFERKRKERNLRPPPPSFFFINRPNKEMLWKVLFVFNYLFILWIRLSMNLYCTPFCIFFSGYEYAFWVNGCRKENSREAIKQQSTVTDRASPTFYHSMPFYPVERIIAQMVSLNILLPNLKISQCFFFFF